MPDKQVTVAVPEERVPEFYSWFAHFLASDPGTPVAGDAGREGWGPAPDRARGRGFGPGGPGRFGHGPGHRGGREHPDAEAWTADDAEMAAWLYAKLAAPAQRLFDLLSAAPGTHIPGNELAAALDLDKGAHGVAGILAWPGRYCRRLGRVMPIATTGRADGGTDYFMEPGVAELFAAAAKGR